MTTTLDGATLFGYWRSSSSWRVRIALAHKGIEVTHTAVHLLRDGGEQHDESYRALNPLAQVPSLRLADGRTLTQSLAIIELLDELVPTPALLPRDAFARARVRQHAELVNAGIQPHVNLATLQALKARSVDDQAWGREMLGRGLAAMEALARQTAGVLMVGDDVTLADCCLVPQLYGARRFQADLTGCPTLTSIEARCLALPAFASTAPDLQPDAPKAARAARTEVVP